MADSKLTALTNLTAVTGDDLFYAVDDPAGTPVQRKVTATVLREFTNMAQATGTDADTTMAVNTLYLVDMSAWTADRTWKPHGTAAVGDLCAVFVTAGSSAYELILTAQASDTLNGVAGGTEWSRLFITNEWVLMRCTVANTAWVVVTDRRIPQQCDMQLTTNADAETPANTFVEPTAAATPGAWTAQIDNASLAVVASDRINVRRAGRFNCIVSGRSKDAPATGKYYNVALYKSAGATLVLLGQAVTSAAGQNPLASNSRLIPLVVDDYLVFKYRNTDAGLGCQADQTWFSIQEVLP